MLHPSKEELIAKPNKKIGDKRTFTTDKRIFTIREILIDPNVKMIWTWNSTVDPITKMRIDREILHTFYRIEILGDERIKDEKLTIDDIFILGDSLDERKMLLTIDKYDEVLLKSKKFKKMR